MHPSSNYKICWDILVIFISILLIYFIPLHIIFDMKFNDLLQFDYFGIIPLILILDIIMSINTGIFHKG